MNKDLWEVLLIVKIIAAKYSLLAPRYVTKPRD